MAGNDAEGKAPTIEEEIATFKGFSTTDGEVSDGKQTAEETAALAARATIEAKAAGTVDGEEGEDDDAAAKAAETPEEKAAREAAEAKLTDKQKAAKALQQKVGGKPAKARSATDRVAQINAATAEMRAAERALQAARQVNAPNAEVESLRREIAELKAGLTTGGKTATVVDKDAPRPTDYQYGELDGAFIRDLARYETRKELAADHVTKTAAAQTDATRAAAREFQTKKDAFAQRGLEKYDDFAEVVMQGAVEQAWPLTKTIGDLMFESDVGDDIGYYLATHPAEATKLMLNPDGSEKSVPAQSAAFGRLETRFSSASSDATPPSTQQDDPAQLRQVQGTMTTKAPTPPVHRARGAGGKTQVSAATTDFAAFEQLAGGST